MGEACIYDRYEQCFHDCEKCVKYERSEECQVCGSSEKIIRDGENIFCARCQAERLISSLNCDCAADFLDENSEKFEKFILEFYEEI